MAIVDNSKELFSANFPSSKVKRKKIIDTIINKLSQIPASFPVKNHELYLIVDEAVSNAMEHGNKWNPQKKVNIKITTDGQTLIIAVEDEGKGFDPETIDKKSKPISPRGRGIQIIKHFCEIKWNDKGNIASLILKLN